MRRLAVKSFGDEVQGIELRGDRRSPEPTYVRVAFPGGDVDVVRASDGSYWIHVRVDQAKDVTASGEPVGQITDARLDVAGKHASETDAGDFGNPGLYHLAVRVSRKAGL